MAQVQERPQSAARASGEKALTLQRVPLAGTMRAGKASPKAAESLEDVRLFLLCRQDDKVLSGLSYALHRLLPGQKAALLRVFMEQFDESIAAGVPAPAQLVGFIELMLRNGRLLPLDSLLDLKVALRRDRSSDRGDRALALIERAISYQSPVMSRWHSDPAADLLGWLQWDDLHMAKSLDALVQPFWQLRAHEFTLPYGPNVLHLNDVANSLSVFVVASTLAGCSISKTTGSAVAARWLSIAKHLLDGGNFHALFAVQCGLCKHQLQRLPGLITGRERRFKRQLDELFDPGDRFQKSAALWTERAGRLPTVVAVFWLVQKAQLLLENPLYEPATQIVIDGDALRRINVDALLAAHNTFDVLYRAQSVPPRSGSFSKSVSENATPTPARQNARAVPISPSIVWTTTPGRFIGADTAAHRAVGRIGVTRQNRKKKRKTNNTSCLTYWV
jgi:hypothetical protein